MNVWVPQLSREVASIPPQHSQQIQGSDYYDPYHQTGNGNVEDEASGATYPTEYVLSKLLAGISGYNAPSEDVKKSCY